MEDETKTVPVITMPAEVMRAAAVFTTKDSDWPTLTNVWTLPDRDVAMASDSYAAVVVRHVTDEGPDPIIDYSGWFSEIRDHTDKSRSTTTVEAKEIASRGLTGYETYRESVVLTPPPLLTPVWPEKVTPMCQEWRPGYLGAFDLVGGALEGYKTKVGRTKSQRHKGDDRTTVTYLGSGSDAEGGRTPGVWVIRTSPVSYKVGAPMFEAAILLMPFKTH